MSVVLDNHCDLCVNEEEPLCIYFCATNALNLSILKELKQNTKKSGL